MKTAHGGNLAKWLSVNDWGFLQLSTPSLLKVVNSKLNFHFLAHLTPSSQEKDQEACTSAHPGEQNRLHPPLTQLEGNCLVISLHGGHTEAPRWEGQCILFQGICREMGGAVLPGTLFKAHADFAFSVVFVLISSLHQLGLFPQSLCNSSACKPLLFWS